MDKKEITYEIIHDSEIKKSLGIDNIQEQGYKIIEKDQSYYLVISHKKSVHCCGNLLVQDVEIDKNNLKIRVDYNDECECIIEEVNYYYSVIKFNQLPNSININNNSYKEIMDDFKIDEEKLIMKISDISKKCVSNQVNIYADNKYQVLKGSGTSVIKQGNLNYSKDFNVLIDKIKTYKADNKTGIIYLIVLNNGEKINVSINQAVELTDMLDLIPLDNMFWCE